MMHFPILLLSALLVLPSAAGARIADDRPAPEAEVTTAGAWLGVNLQEITPEIARAMKLSDAHGALVGDVDDESPAEKAGIRKGDILVRIEGSAVEDPEDVVREVGRREPGVTLSLEVIRDGKTVTLTPRLAVRPAARALPDWSERRWRRAPRAIPEADAPHAPREPRAPGAPRSPRAPRAPHSPPAALIPPRAQLGVRIQPMDEDLAAYFGVKPGEGVLVTGVEANSPAAEAGLKSGDVIRKIDGRDVESAEDLVRGVRGHDPGDAMTLTILRQRRETELKAVLDAADGPQRRPGWSPRNRRGDEAPPVRLGEMRRELRRRLPMARSWINDELRRMDGELNRLREEVQEMREKKR